MIVFVDRSLCKTRAGLEFKGTKTEKPRRVELPPSVLDWGQGASTAPG